MGLSPKRALGQNFLVNPSVIDKILGRVDRLNKLDPSATILEVGPGLGALTERLIDLGLKPHLIELDQEFAAYWRERTLGVTEGDALKVNWDSLVGKSAILVSNLPYQIASPLVVDRCAGPAEIHAMVLMFQREVAERLVAKPGSKSYGLLSVVAQWHFSIEKVVDAAPRDFYPAPKVSSRVMAFTRRNRAWDPRRMTFLRGAFALRRKFLLKNLKAVVDKSLHGRALEGLGTLGFSEKARAEELTPEQLWRLFEIIYGN